MALYGIDASLTSTAVCRYESGSIGFQVFTTSKPGKWHRLMEQVGVTHEVKFAGADNYSDSEVAKLVSYRTTATNLVISLGLRPGDVVRMEGYAFRSNGDIVDLVTYGTFIREAVLATGASLSIIAPTQLKSTFADTVYDRKDGAKKPARNELGVAGGKFTKFEMLRAVVDGQRYGMFMDDFAVKVCRESASDILGESVDPYAGEPENPVEMALKTGMKAVPSPINDCVDAYALCMTAVHPRQYETKTKKKKK